MRAQDVDECLAAGHSDMRQVLAHGVAKSTWACTAAVGGVPAAIFGVAPLSPNLLDPTGVPWLLGTDLVPQHQRALARLAPRYITEMLRAYPRLMNVVHARNTVSLRWLERMGFSIHPPHRHKGTGEMFHLFEMRDV